MTLFTLRVLSKPFSSCCLKARKTYEQCTPQEDELQTCQDQGEDVEHNQPHAACHIHIGAAENKERRAKAAAHADRIAQPFIASASLSLSGSHT
jgi:hypothetical protein